jgi:hypothetical protein
MSHSVTVSTDVESLTDLNLVQRACKKLGWTFSDHKYSAHLHYIQIPGRAGPLSLEVSPQNKNALLTYDTDHVDERDINKLMQRYQAERVYATVGTKYGITEKTTNKGEILLTLTTY